MCLREQALPLECRASKIITSFDCLPSASISSLTTCMLSHYIHAYPMQCQGYQPIKPLNRSTPKHPRQQCTPSQGPSPSKTLTPQPPPPPYQHQPPPPKAHSTYSHPLNTPIPLPYPLPTPPPAPLLPQSCLQPSQNAWDPILVTRARFVCWGVVC